MKIILCTGGFDPIHSGHLNYLHTAKRLGDKLIVGLNSEEWLCRKKGKAFQSFNERFHILNSLECVDFVINFDDSDDSSKNAIEKVQKLFPNDEIVFANGGDRTIETLPKSERDMEIEYAFNIGGHKTQSSTKMLKKWGFFDILYQTKNSKTKLLEVEPRETLSMQCHEKRSEHWIVIEGQGLLNGEELKEYTYIDKNEWHQLSNPNEETLRIIEIQIGECEENDIRRIKTNS